MAVALLAGADHRYRMQDARSLADWGDHRGSPLAEMSRLYQPEDVIRDVVMAAVEAAYDNRNSSTELCKGWRLSRSHFANWFVP